MLGFMTLRTTALVSGSSASNTIPMPPLPRTAKHRYGPNRPSPRLVVVPARGRTSPASAEVSDPVGHRPQRHGQTSPDDDSPRLRNCSISRWIASPSDMVTAGTFIARTADRRWGGCSLSPNSRGIRPGVLASLRSRPPVGRGRAFSAKERGTCHRDRHDERLSSRIRLRLPETMRPGE